MKHSKDGFIFCYSEIVFISKIDKEISNIFEC